MMQSKSILDIYFNKSIFNKKKIHIKKIKIPFFGFFLMASSYDSVPQQG